MDLAAFQNANRFSFSYRHITCLIYKSIKYFFQEIQRNSINLKKLNCWHFNIYEQDKFKSQLS